MFVPFESLPDSSRIWIYQSDKPFDHHATRILSEGLLAFTQTWAAHGSPMKASFQLLHNHFIVIAADEQSASASGCSIDSSVRVIKALGEDLGLDFFDRQRIAFLRKDDVVLVPVKVLKTALEQGEWNGETLTFNNLIGTKGELSSWTAPSARTWLARYLSGESVVK